jgi:iron complex outermembrane recepter protein
MRVCFLLSVACLALAAPAFAQEEKGDHHSLSDPEIIVTAIYARNQADVLSGTSTLVGEELARDIRPTIGDTLAKQPGVSATSFGPNASRPVLRGFQGERVRVLADGIGSFDVSNTSVDHAVVLNPLTSDRIEVLRGPAALLFGSNAIGGVVNVIDSRIPRRIRDDHIHADAIATYGSAAKERSIGARVDVPLGERFTVHIDGNYSKRNDLKSGGFILAPAQRAQALASGDPEIEELANLRGKIPNTAARTWELAGGFAYITSTANFGASVAHYDSLYGVPVRYATTPLGPDEEGPEQVRLDVKQTRYDVRGEINPESGFFEAIKMRGGYADYEHAELEEDNSVGTRFFNTGGEMRLELVQREKGSWKGAIGVQGLTRKLRIEGEEKYLPPIRNRQIGLFTVQSFDLGLFKAEAGARLENSRIKARADVDIGNGDTTRKFTTASGSLGGSYEFANNWRVGLNASYTERAPSAEELFPNGPHAGTQAFEIGNINFNKEKSRSLEMTVRGKGDRFTLGGAVYKSWFSNFIYELPTGEVEDGLPVFQFFQNKANYVGAEVDATVTVVQLDQWKINLDTVADFTKAKIKPVSGTINAPRIPARRVLAGLEAIGDFANVRAEIEFVKGQKRVAPFETATNGYKLVNLSAAFRPWGEESPVSLDLSANNVFNVNARRHASFLKDYAPLAGTDIRAGVRVKF